MAAGRAEEDAEHPAEGISAGTGSRGTAERGSESATQSKMVPLGMTIFVGIAFIAATSAELLAD